MYVEAAKPAMSPTTPPPRAKTTLSRSAWLGEKRLVQIVQCLTTLVLLSVFKPEPGDTSKKL